MSKRHYWLVVVKTGNGESAMNVDTNTSFINKSVLDDCAIRSKKSSRSCEAMVVNVSYLGEMTQEEWNQ